MKLPELDTRQPDEPTAHYGLRVLTFMLHTGVTATLTDDDLRLADHMARVAVSAPEILPIAVDKISAVRHTIALVLKDREWYAEGIIVSIPEGPKAIRPDPSGPPSEAVLAKPYPLVTPPAGATARF